MCRCSGIVRKQGLVYLPVSRESLSSFLYEKTGQYRHEMQAAFDFNQEPEPEPEPVPELPSPALLLDGDHRHPDYETSVAAARMSPGRRSSMRVQLGQAFRDHPEGLTDEEAAGLAGVPMRSCWWKRCGELREMGWIGWTGLTRTSDTSGAEQNVWEMSAELRSAWDALELK